jgi:ABC-type transporter Mla maintaining outer membrane lipid asymmetry ATPase subunit MlaF
MEPSPAPPLVEARKVWKSFGDNRVLRGVSLAVPKGTILAVMGGSGTGKTVLLRIVSGLASPTQGRSTSSAPASTG